MRVRIHRGINGIIFTILFFTHYSYSWQTIPCKDATRGNGTFSFPVKTYVGFGNVLYAYATESGLAKEYALSFLKNYEDTVKPYAPGKIKVNGILEQSNPLYDSGISLITSMDERNLLVALNTKPQVLCNLNCTEMPEIITMPCLRDVQGQEVNEPIVAVAGGQGKAFVAVKAQDEKKFGVGASGIALVAYDVREQEEEVSAQAYAELRKKAQDTHDEHALKELTQGITTDKDGTHKKKTIIKKLFQQDIAALNLGSECIKIAEDLCAIDDRIDIHWNENLKCVYIGLSLQGGQEEKAGACALIVGHINELNKLILNPVIAPDLVTQQQIIAGKGSNAAVSIHKVTSMLTTTSLDYIIIQGGNGSASDTQTTVYALPILNFRTLSGTVSSSSQSVHGTLAHKNGAPLEGFSVGERTQIFQGRHFVEMPKSPDDVCIMQTIAARVGAGQLSAGPIADIFIEDDAVYAIVNAPFENHEAGIYYSRAIFDNVGRIAAWTAWQPKIIAHDQEIEHATIIRSGGSIEISTRHDAHGIIKRSGWAKNGDDPLMGMISKEFSQSQGGVHGLIDFPSNTPGLDENSCLAILGSNKVMLAHYKNHVNSVTFIDSLLGEIGPISTAEIISNHPFGWLLVGGARGLAVLCHDDGSGWHRGTINDYFLNLNRDMHFKRIGSYCFVRKIIADEHFVYILTDTEFDRIDLTASDFTTGRLHITRLAGIGQCGEFGIFKDVIVSEKFALLATSNGLYRAGNKKDVRWDDHTSINWKPLNIPEAVGPVSTLVAISMSGRMQDVARGAAGQIYIVTGSMGKNAGRLHRFAVSCVIDSEITDATIMPLRDLITENTYSYYANFGNFTSLFATDGTLFFTQGIYRRNKIKKQILNNSYGKTRYAMPLGLDNDAMITCIARNSASGNWMVGGDFGLFINE